MANGNQTQQSMGLMSGMGLDTRTPRQMRMGNLQNMQTQNQEALMQQQQGFAPANYGVASAAANLGTQLGGLFANKQPGQGLNPEQQRALQIREDGQRRFAQRLKENPTQDAREKSLMHMRSFADAALEAGDLDTYHNLSMQAAKEAQEARLIETKMKEAEGVDPAAARQEFVNDTLTSQWSSSQRQARADNVLQIQDYSRVVGGVSDVLTSMYQLGVAPEAVMGTAGGVTKFLEDAVSTVRGVGSAVGNIISGGNRDPETGQIRGGESLSQEEMQNRFNIETPEYIKGAREQSMYRSLMIQLAYQQWRANEGSGARQASDQDIERALAAIGANSGSPSVVASTLASNYRNTIANLANRRRQEHIRGATYGLTPQEIDTGLFGADFDTIADEAEDTMIRLHTVTGLQESDTDSGRATVPVPAATPAETEDDGWSIEVIE